MQNFDWVKDSKCGSDEDYQTLLRETKYDPLFDTNSVKGRQWAAQYCSDCPVRIACEWNGEKEDYGIWGGLNPRARKLRVSARNKSLARLQKRAKELSLGGSDFPIAM